MPCQGIITNTPETASVSVCRYPEGAEHEGCTPSEVDNDVATRVERECAEQGIPVAIEDPVTVAKILTLVRDGCASRSATKTATSARRGRPSASAKGR
jgi:hypothetical protein